MNILCTNKKASFKYSLTKKIEAGIVLEGWEVKSIKLGHAQISESYISVLDPLFHRFIPKYGVLLSSLNQNPKIHNAKTQNPKNNDISCFNITQKSKCPNK